MAGGQREGEGRQRFGLSRASRWRTQCAACGTDSRTGRIRRRTSGWQRPAATRSDSAHARTASCRDIGTAKRACLPPGRCSTRGTASLPARTEAQVLCPRRQDPERTCPTLGRSPRDSGPPLWAAEVVGAARLAGPAAAAAEWPAVAEVGLMSTQRLYSTQRKRELRQAPQPPPRASQHQEASGRGGRCGCG